MTTEIRTVNSTELAQQVNEEFDKETAGGISGAIGSVLTWHLGNYIYPKKLGRLFNAQTDFELKNIGRRQPDLAFVTFDRLPVNVRDTVPVEPDLAVEVASKTDNLYDIDDKVDEYLRAGVKMVWVVRPIRQIIEVYRKGKHVKVYDVNDELDGEDVLPGFRLKVSELFV